MGCGASKPVDVDLVGQQAEKSAVFAAGKYVVPPGGPPLTLGWAGPAKEIFDVRTGEVLFKKYSADTFTSADGAPVWQQVAVSFTKENCVCFSTAVFECVGGEKLANANEQDVALCADCDPKPTFFNMNSRCATVTGATWDGEKTLKVSFENSGNKDTAKLMWKDGSTDAASLVEKQGQSGSSYTATFNDVPRDKQLFFGLRWVVFEPQGIQVAAITQSGKAACTLRWPPGSAGQEFYGTYRSTTGDQLQLRGLNDRVELAAPGSHWGSGPAIAKSANKKQFAAELKRLGRLQEKGKPAPTGPHPLEDAALQKYGCFLEVAPGVDAAAVLAFWLARAWLSGEKAQCYRVATSQ